MDDRFEELLNRWAQAFWLITKLLKRCGIEIPFPDPQIPGITRPAVTRAIHHLDHPGLPRDAQTAVTTVIVKWLAAADLLDQFEAEPDPWMGDMIETILAKLPRLAQTANAELDRRDQAN